MKARLRRAGIAAALALLLGGPASAETAAPLTTEDVGGFLDRLVPPALERGNIPGAVVAVVKDGAVLVERGYGYADRAGQKRPDPQRTLFRPGSISKTFTWTAVMQLVEQGKLDLDADVNTYLDFRIPATWPKPVTMRELMTHTAGFEDRSEDIVYWDPQAMPDDEHYLKSWIPTRIYPPGTVIAYSNYGAALAGYIVQRVSGEPFADYVQRHILAPLGMGRTTFQEPLPATLAEDMATGYRPDGATPKPFEMIAPVPAGALSTTADDMARFMIAQLQDGRFGEQRILQEQTARTMHAKAFQPSPAVNGMALGFRRADRNGQAIIAHAGGTFLFQSDMNLFLDQGIGIFISMNGDGADNAADRLRRTLLQHFADRYFPHALPEAPTLASAREHARLAAGWYDASQRSADSPGAFLGLLTQVRVSAEEDGTLTVNTLTDLDGKPRQWREVQPFVWRALDDEGNLAMQVQDGKVASILAPPLYTFLPVPWWRSAALNIPLLEAALAIFAFGALAWPAASLLRLVFRSRPRISGRRRLIYAACLLNLAFLGGLPLFLGLVATDAVLSLTDAIDPWLRLLQLCGVLGLAGTGLAAYEAFAGGSWANWAWVGRLGHGAIALAGLAALWFGLAFHLLSWNLNF